MWEFRRFLEENSSSQNEHAYFFGPLGLIDIRSSSDRFFGAGFFLLLGFVTALALALSSGMNCIKIGLAGKLILSKRKGLWEVLFS